jgi:hypothetical protein
MLRALSLGLLFIAGFPAVAGEYRLLRIDGFHVKWGLPAYGRAAAVSYGFAAERQVFPDAVNCREIAPVGAISGASVDARRQIESAATAAFEMWGMAAGLTFRQVSAGETPDILIGAQARPEGIAFANVWHAAAKGGIASLTRATICLNPDVPWLAAASVAGGEVYDVRTVLAHEIGHAIGLDHPGATGALMAFRNQGLLEALRPGDVAGALALYGPSSRGDRLPAVRRARAAGAPPPAP